MPTKSPTARTMDLLRRDGWTPAVTERWNPYAHVRQDLFGIIDVLAIRPDVPGVLAVQCTSQSNASARRAKALAEPRLKTWLMAGQTFEVWGWVKRAGRWEVKRTPLVLADFEGNRVDGADEGTLATSRSQMRTRRTERTHHPPRLSTKIVTPLNATNPLPAPQAPPESAQATGMTNESPPPPKINPGPSGGECVLSADSESSEQIETTVFAETS